jgi:uncharacterized coiled-coil protein SlyX
MQIKQLSAMLDTKLAELDARVVKQEKNLSNTEITEEKNKIQLELNELARLRNKLIKSKELAWEAHSLEKNSNKKLNQRKAIIGLVLCAIGGITALVLLYIVISEYLK